MSTAGVKPAVGRDGGGSVTGRSGVSLAGTRLGVGGMAVEVCVGTVSPGVGRVPVAEGKGLDIKVGVKDATRVGVLVKVAGAVVVGVAVCVSVVTGVGVRVSSGGLTAGSQWISQCWRCEPGVGPTVSSA